MGTGIYKQHQGYWTRVCSAIAMAVIVLLGAKWAWDQLGQIRMSDGSMLVYVQAGGAAFLVLYVGITLVVGLPVLLAEFALGRGSGRSPIGALAHYGGNHWRPLGWLFVASGFLILSYYSVIAGWTVRYALTALVGGFPEDLGGFFERVATGGSSVAWHLGFMGVCIAIVRGGVKRGIERSAVALMPILFLLVIGLAFYAATLEGAGAGYRFYLEVDFDELRNWDVVQAAAGQAFFSLSLGMGCMMTYASYLGRGDNLPNQSVVVAVSDFGVAFVAGLAVFPLIFALGLDSEVTSGSVGTMGALFITKGIARVAATCSPFFTRVCVCKVAHMTSSTILNAASDAFSTIRSPSVAARRLILPSLGLSSH